MSNTYLNRAVSDSEHGADFNFHGNESGSAEFPAFPTETPVYRDMPSSTSTLFESSASIFGCGNAFEANFFSKDAGADVSKHSPELATFAPVFAGKPSTKFDTISEEPSFASFPTPADSSFVPVVPTCPEVMNVQPKPQLVLSTAFATAQPLSSIESTLTDLFDKYKISTEVDNWEGAWGAVYSKGVDYCKFLVTVYGEQKDTEENFVVECQKVNGDGCVFSNLFSAIRESLLPCCESPVHEGKSSASPAPENAVLRRALSSDDQSALLAPILQAVTPAYTLSKDAEDEVLGDAVYKNKIESQREGVRLLCELVTTSQNIRSQLLQENCILSLVQCLLFPQCYGYEGRRFDTVTGLPVERRGESDTSSSVVAWMWGCPCPILQQLLINTLIEFARHADGCAEIKRCSELLGPFLHPDQDNNMVTFVEYLSLAKDLSSDGNKASDDITFGNESVEAGGIEVYIGGSTLDNAKFVCCCSELSTLLSTASIASSSASPSDTGCSALLRSSCSKGAGSGSTTGPLLPSVSCY